MQDVLENEFSKQVTSNHWYKNSDDDTVYLKEKDAKKAFEEKYMKDFSEKNMNILSLICNVAKKHLCMKFTRGTGMGWGRPPWDQSVTKFILANLDFIRHIKKFSTVLLLDKTIKIRSSKRINCFFRPQHIPHSKSDDCNDDQPNQTTFGILAHETSTFLKIFGMKIKV